jgi:hypothetical protein
MNPQLPASVETAVALIMLFPVAILTMAAIGHLLAPGRTPQAGPTTPHAARPAWTRPLTRARPLPAARRT